MSVPQSRTMHCTLLIPRLFWSRETSDAVMQGLELPALAKLLARSAREYFAHVTLEAWLCQAFEVERQQDWPIAPLTFALDRGEPGTAYWLRADPVHIRVSRDRLLLVASDVFELNEDDAQAIVSALNAHFRNDGVVFEAPEPKRWYVKLAETPRLVTHSVREAAGRDVQDMLPAGDDALIVHRVFNEAQMLLHALPVNTRREALGQAPVNSVWFWGGGTHARARGRPFSHVWSDEDVAIALAASADVPSAPLPRRAADWLAHASAGEQTDLLVFDALARAFAYRDVDAWRAELSELEAEWFAPLLRALEERRLATLAIIALGDAHCCRFGLARGDLFKVWRRHRSVAAYA